MFFVCKGAHGYTNGMRMSFHFEKKIPGLTSCYSPLRQCSAPAGRRSGGGLAVREDAWWQAPGGAAPRVELIDISLSGARVRGGALPAVGSRGLVALSRETSSEMVTVPAEVVWKRAG